MGLLAGGGYLVSLVGEAARSLLHSGLSIVLIRALTAADYGVFAVLFFVGALANLYSGALFSAPAKIYIPQATSAASRVLDVGLGSAALAICANSGSRRRSRYLVLVGASERCWSCGCFCWALGIA